MTNCSCSWFTKFYNLTTQHGQQCTLLKSCFLKGALDMYRIYLFISNSVDDFKLNQYRNLQPILPMHFLFMKYFVNSIIFRASHRLLYRVFIEVYFEKIESARNFHISSKVNLQHKTQHAVITHANTSNSTEIPTFFWKKVGDDVILVQLVGSYLDLPWPPRAEEGLRVDLDTLRYLKKIEPLCPSRKCGPNLGEAKIQDGRRRPSWI